MEKVQALTATTRDLEATNIKRIGIMGGTFNPIHNGHLIIAEQVASQLALDQVLFLPNNIPPHVDKKKAIEGNVRAEMVNLAIEDNSHFKLETIELAKGGVSYSYNTVLALKKKYPATSFYFIIGADEVEYLPKWYQIDELIKEVIFVAVRRHGYQGKTKYQVIWVDTPLIEISSTDIRKRIEQHTSIKYLVPQKVANFIEDRRLYQNDWN